MKTRINVCILVASMVALAAPMASAIQLEWQGDVSSVWTNGDNWNSGLVPIPSANVYFGNGASNQTVLPKGTPQAVGSIDFGGSKEFTFGDDGYLDLTAGDVTASASAVTNTIQCVLTNSGGSLSFSIGPAATLEAAGQIVGHSSLTKSSAGILRLRGANTYSGVTTINGGILLADNQTGSATGTGVVTVATGATLAGNGTVAGPVIISSGGTVAPGSSAGSLTVGSVTFASGSFLNMEIGGTLPGTQHDQLLAGGTVSLAGTLNMSYTNGFNAALGGSFTLIQAGTVSGTFANVISPDTNQSWVINYSATAVTAARIPTNNTVHALLTNNATPVLSGNIDPNGFHSLKLSFNGASWSVNDLILVTLPGFSYNVGSGDWSFDLSDVGLSPPTPPLLLETLYDVTVTGYTETDLSGVPVTDMTTNEVSYDVSATINVDDETDGEDEELWVHGESTGIEDGQPVAVTFDRGMGYSTSMVTSIDSYEWEASFVFTGWPDGTVVVTVVSSDLAGNVASNSAPIMLYTSAAISIDRSLFGDGHLTSNEFSSGVLTGSTRGVEAGLSVTVTATDRTGRTAAFRTPVDGGGNWSVPLNSLPAETWVEQPALEDDIDRSPDVATFDDGSFVICWERRVDSASPDIWHQRFSSTGVALSNQVMVNASNSVSDSGSTVAVLKDQGYVIGWTRQGGGVFYRRFGSNGVPQGGETQVEGEGGAFTDVTALSDGGWVFTWRSTSGDRNILQRRYDAAGAAGAIVEVSHNPDTINDDYPAISGLADDGWVIAWRKDSIPGDGTDYEIFTQRYDSSGNTNPVGFTMVNASDTQPDHHPAVAGLTNGGWVVTWQGDGDAGDGTDSEIMLQQFNSNGVAVGSNTKVDAADSYYNDDAPEITALQDGGWVIAWSGQPGNASGYAEIFMQRYSNTGVASTNVDIIVNSSDENPDMYPEIASFPDGRWVIVWQDVEDQRIAYRLFDANGRGAGLETLANGLLDITVTVWNFMWHSATDTTSIVMDLNFDEVQPVLHWILEEGAGTNTVEVISGETNVANLIEAVAWTNGLAPASGKASWFDDTPISSYIAAGTLTNGAGYVSGSAPEYMELSGGYTVSAWVRLNAIQDGAERVILSSDEDLLTGWSLRVRNGTTNRLGYDFGGLSIDSGIELPVETDLFIALAVDESGAAFNSGNTYRFSVYDGGRWKFSEGLAYSAMRLQGMEIGSSGTGQHQFEGVIDDVRIYDRTLSQSDIDHLTQTDTDEDGTLDYEDPDDDNDGLSDNDEETLATSTKDPDTDDDGMNDGNEVIAGTNPKDNASLFIVTDVSTVSSNVVFHWSSASNRTYSLWGSSNLLSDTWQFIGGSIAGTPPYNAVTVTPLTVEAQFYRILVEVE